MSFREISAFDFATAPARLFAKQKLLLTAEDAEGRPNSMTVGWGGIGVMWGVPVVAYAIRPGRYTYGFAETGRRVSLAAFAEEDGGLLSYFGTHSGREEDKYAAASLTPIRMPDGGIGFLRATLVITAEKCYAAPIEPACFFDREIDGKWYPKKDYHKLYFATIRGIYQKNE